MKSKRKAALLSNLTEMYCLCFFLSLTLASILASPLTPSSVRSESASFSYDPDSGIGPNDWGSIPGYEKCGLGTSQSPIEIDLKGIEYMPISRGPLPNLGETAMRHQTTTENFELHCEDEGKCGFTTFEGQRFDLVNLHFHSNSEHTLMGMQYPLEMQMVHSSDSGELLVIGTLFRYTDEEDDKDDVENEVFEELLDQLESGKTDVTVDMAGLLGDLGYMGYSGSLTTPACTEEVNWFIALKRQLTSRTQVQRYRAIAGSGPVGNNRPVQTLNGRHFTAFV